MPAGRVALGRGLRDPFSLAPGAREGREQPCGSGTFSALGVTPPGGGGAASSTRLEGRAGSRVSFVGLELPINFDSIKPFEQGLPSGDLVAEGIS